MSLSLFCSAIIVFWICIYYKHSKLPRNGSLLPLNSRPRDVTVPDGLDLENSLCSARIGNSIVNIELAGFLLLRCWTNLYVEKGRKAQNGLVNDFDDSTNRDRSSSIPRHSNASKSRVLTVLYNFGSVIAFVGQIFAVGMLSWSAVLLFGRYYRFFVPGSEPAVSVLGKRGSEALPPHSAVDRQTSTPRLLIPGFNIPLSHIYPIVIAMLLCTGLHEYGHAVTASMENIPLTKWGYNVFAVIPAAFVELVPPKVQHPLSRIRIASAGVFHNFITIAILYSLSSFHLREFFLPFIGYRHLQDGVEVIGFAQDSPLSQHIPAGAMITHINDDPIKSYFEITTLESWSNTLLSGQQETTGWCLRSSSLHARLVRCCYLESTLASGDGTCFTSYDGTENGCIDPLVIMEDPAWPRCDSNFDCSNNEDICVRPHPSTSLVRIIFQYPIEEKSRTIVWNGPKQEVLEQIVVDNFEPRFSFLPKSLPFWLKVLVEYINTVSISLFFLNLLPVRVLDGGELFLAIAELVSPKSQTAETFDLESRTMHTRTHHAKSILVFFERTTIILASSLAISSLLPL